MGFGGFSVRVFLFLLVLGFFCWVWFFLRLEEILLPSLPARYKHYKNI